ncbi:MAG: RnfABCDGE type electron transport complex subunit A [Planctomycetota bacterium]|nr:RnfABCDGE type electron transport complex subunit A [Planctomycetota bacterium]
MQIFLLLLGAVFVNNFILAKFIGICPFIGVSKKVGPAIGMSLAVIFVMALSSIATWLIDHYILIPRDLTYLRTLVFIIVIAGLVQFVEMVILKTSPSLYKALGIFLPLITTNCQVLAMTVMNVREMPEKYAAMGYSFGLVPSVAHAVGIACGFSVALLIMAAIRERLELAPVPESLKGWPLAFLLSGQLSLAFMGFVGMMK